MQFETSIDIDAAPDAVWTVLTDVERWPEWTASMKRVERLDEGPFAVGSRARVRQPRLATAIWGVVALEPGRSFSWTAHSPGITSIGEHWVEPRPGGATVTLGISQAGPLAPIAGLLTSRLARRYVRTEAEGLKRRCERAGDG